jgi:hypothetical protein
MAFPGNAFAESIVMAGGEECKQNRAGVAMPQLRALTA